MYISVYYLWYFHSFTYISFYLLLLLPDNMGFKVASLASSIHAPKLSTVATAACYLESLSPRPVFPPSLCISPSFIPSHTIPKLCKEFRPSTTWKVPPQDQSHDTTSLAGLNQPGSWAANSWRDTICSFTASHLQSLKETIFQRGQFPTAFGKSFTQLRLIVNHTTVQD